MTLADRDLDWVAWQVGVGSSGPAPGPLLGPAAIGRADAVLVPALAVARDGVRLGRGGGSYDRALPRRAAEAELIALVFDGEIHHDLPAQPWDVPVGAAVTPSGHVPLRNTAVAPDR